MNGPHRAAWLLWMGTLSATSLVQAASDELLSELGRCAAITKPEGRLACYDALAGRASQPASASAAPQASSATSPPSAAAATQATPSAPTAAAPAAAFGLSSAPVHAESKGGESIEAHVAQLTQDRSLRSLVALDNGQTWMSTEGELELKAGEPVTIKRAALGSFMLVAAVSKHSYHVRRVR